MLPPWFGLTTCCTFRIHVFLLDMLSLDDDNAGRQDVLYMTPVCYRHVDTAAVDKVPIYQCY